MSTPLDNTSARRLRVADLDAVVAIDSAIVGRSRRSYFERRLHAALNNPKLHVQFAVEKGGELLGYALARRLEGEFGRTEPALRLEVISVHPGHQGRHTGETLLSALERWAREHDIREIRTQASWKNHTMLRFLDHAGFSLAKHQVLDCEVHVAKKNIEREHEEHEHEQEGSSTSPSTEIDYSAPADSSRTLARDRNDIRVLTASDAPAIARIDRLLTGRDRSSYIEQAVKEALSGSAVRVSLTARRPAPDASLEGSPVLGFVMARTDLGDFGHTEPVAVLDTLGVDPSSAHSGAGTALLSQLFVNLAALHVERVETIVSRDDFDLLGFLYKVGFGPSQRLGFEKRL